MKTKASVKLIYCVFNFILSLYMGAAFASYDNRIEILEFPESLPSYMPVSMYDLDDLIIDPTREHYVQNAFNQMILDRETREQNQDLLIEFVGKNKDPREFDGIFEHLLAQVIVHETYYKRGKTWCKKSREFVSLLLENTSYPVSLSKLYANLVFISTLSSGKRVKKIKTARHFKASDSSSEEFLEIQKKKLRRKKSARGMEGYQDKNKGIVEVDSRWSLVFKELALRTLRESFMKNLDPLEPNNRVAFSILDAFKRRRHHFLIFPSEALDFSDSELSFIAFKEATARELLFVRSDSDSLEVKSAHSKGLEMSEGGFPQLDSGRVNAQGGLSSSQVYIERHSIESSSSQDSLF